MTTFSGFIGLGTGSGSFTEQTGTGYARVAVTMSDVSNRRTSNVASATFSATATGWGTVTQYALFSAVSGGVPLIWWNKEIPVSVLNGNSLVLAASQLQLFFADTFYNAGIVTLWGVGDVIGYDNAANPLNVGYPLSASHGIIRSNAQMSGFGTRIGFLKTANMNVTTDQAFTMVGFGQGSFIVEKILACNASVSLTTAVGGVYSAVSKSGAIVANTQAYSTLTSSSLYFDLTLGAGPATAIYSAPIYLSLTTGQGVAATADLHVFGQILG